MPSVNVGDDVLAASVNQLLLKPLVRLVAQATQSIPSATNTPIVFGVGSEEIDTNNFHDVSTNNTRVTPTISGYYRCNGVVMFGAPGNPPTYNVVNAWIRFSGTVNKAPSWRSRPVASTDVFSAVCQAIVAVDATNGDYVELVASQTSSTGVAISTNQSSQFSSSLELEFLRPLT